MSGASPLAGDPAIETGNGAALNGSGCVAGGRPIPPKLYRIGEVVEYSGYSRQTIHNYTIIGLLRESRWTKGGHRLYDESVFARLDLIAQLKAQGVPLQEIRQRVCGTEAAGVM